MSDFDTLTASKGTHNFAIKLTEEQIGPFPLSVEWMWFDEENGNFRLKNIPFFVDNISYDDVVSLVEVDSSLYQIGAVITPSANSTVWLLTKNAVEGRKVLDAISGLGCGVEGGVLSGYYAINLPSIVSFSRLKDVLNSALKTGSISVDYPSIRHDHP